MVWYSPMILCRLAFYFFASPMAYYCQYSLLMHNVSLLIFIYMWNYYNLMMRHLALMYLSPHRAEAWGSLRGSTGWGMSWKEHRRRTLRLLWPVLESRTPTPWTYKFWGHTCLLCGHYLFIGLKLNLNMFCNYIWRRCISIACFTFAIICCIWFMYELLLPWFVYGD